jgi:hypothetical protein
MTALAGIGPRALMIGQYLDRAGAGFAKADGDALVFDIYLNEWMEQYGLRAVSQNFPGLFVAAAYAGKTPLGDLAKEYESTLTVSLSDGAVRVQLVCLEPMGRCDGCEMGEECIICIQQGEVPRLETALEEYYGPLVPSAIAALDTPEPTPPAAPRSR